MASDTRLVASSRLMAAENDESYASAVSWGAVIGGAVAAAGLTILLVALGAGIGLSSVSPWSSANPSATTFTLLTAVWLIIVQWLSSAGGGYLAGRLRIKWAGLHTDEVFFRDTAHGFLAWALATALIAVAASFSVLSAAGTAGRAISNAAGAAASAGTQVAPTQSSAPSGYYVDSLLRTDQLRPDVNLLREATGEASRILARSIANETLDPGDRTYLAKLIAVRAGISQQDAETRVDDVVAQMKAAEEKAKQFADQGRKAAVKTSFFVFFSMLIGAFIASVAGAIGGRQREEA